MATKFPHYTSVTLKLFFFFFLLWNNFNPWSCSRVAWKACLLGLNIEIMHWRGNQELSSWNPQRPIRGLWHGCQNTDRLNQRAQRHAHTHSHATAYLQTHTHPCTWNPRDRLFYQCSFDWHLLSWVFFKPPTLKDTTMQHCRIICDTVIIKTFFFVVFSVAKMFPQLEDNCKSVSWCSPPG